MGAALGMVHFLALMIPLAVAKPPADLVEKVNSAWQETRNYCGSFVFAVYGKSNMAANTGKACVDRKGRVLTETDGPLGPVIDIRLPGEAWYYDPSRPVITHLIAKEGSEDPARPGQGIGEWVELLNDATSTRPLKDQTIDGRKHWLVELHSEESANITVLFIDQKLKLPTALELRKDDKPLLSSGYTSLSLNKDLPEAYFQIRPLFNVPTVEISWDPAESPADASQKVDSPG